MRHRSRRIAVHLLVACIALGFLFPFIVMVTTSLKPMSEIRSQSPLSLPQDVTFSAWIKAWSSACVAGECHGISPAFANTLKIVIPALGISLSLGALTGYALAVHPSRRADLFFRMLLIGLFIPVQVTLFPLIVLIRELGLFGTRAGAIVTHVIWGLPFTTMLFRNYFVALPTSMLHAARIDGAGFFRTLWHIILPMSMPAVLVAGALQFTFLWNEFLLNLTFAGSDNAPLTVALSILTGAQLEVQEYNVNMAAAIIAAAPTVLIYLLFGRLSLGHVHRVK